MVISLLETVVITNVLHHSSMKYQQVPNWVKVVVLRHIARLICYKWPQDVQEKDTSDNGNDGSGPWVIQSSSLTPAPQRGENSSSSFLIFLHTSLTQDAHPSLLHVQAQPSYQNFNRSVGTWTSSTATWPPCRRRASCGTSGATSATSWTFSSSASTCCSSPATLWWSSSCGASGSVSPDRPGLHLENRVL